MGLGDAFAVAEFQTRTWNECYAGLVPQAYLDAQTVSERLERWTASLRSRAREAALVEVDGAVVGVASWTTRELTSLYVAAAHRGLGVADALLERAVGDRPAHLWVFRDNARARRFYARHGFRLDDGSERVDVGTGVLEVRLSRP